MARVLQGLAVVFAGLAIALIAQDRPAQPPRAAIKFDHAQHAKLGDLGPILRAARKANSHLRPDATVPGTGCEACHSGVRENVHRDALSKMGDCLVCHTKVDPPFSCGMCHIQPAESLKPASHIPGFLDKHSAGVAKLGLSKPDCAVCHARKFTCLGCH